jgi:hypothetical protein
MIKNKKIKLASYAGFFIAISFIQVKGFGQFQVKDGIIANIVTFLSILFGFYVTSLAIFITSKYVSELYKVIDRNDPAVTLLHTLVKRFKMGMNIILATILYLFIIEFYYGKIPNAPILFSDKLLWLFCDLMIFNFVYSYWMLNDLVKIIIQEAKK